MTILNITRKKEALNLKGSLISQPVKNNRLFLSTFVHFGMQKEGHLNPTRYYISWLMKKQPTGAVF